MPKTPQHFNIMIVAQRGRLEYEACVFAASLRQKSPGFQGRFIVAEPQSGDRWDFNPGISDPAVRSLLLNHGAEIVPFENVHFGQSYPNGNKIEALKTLPAGEPFVFFDTDTLITDELTDVPFDFDRPSASNKVTNTWPAVELYGPTVRETWRSLYRKFDLDFRASQNKGEVKGHWKRYLYFNAGYFYYKCPQIFGDKFLDYAVQIRDDAPEELVCQTLDPWLDQVALPLVIHALGGGRDTLDPGFLDGKTTCHYRFLPLLYARESDKVIQTLEEVLAPNPIKKVVKGYDPIKRMVFQKRGHKARALFDQNDLPRKEGYMRKILKENKLWLR